MFVIIVFILICILVVISNNDQKKRGSKLPMEPITEEQFMKLNFNERSKIFEAHYDWNTGGDVYKLFGFIVICKKKVRK